MADKLSLAGVGDKKRSDASTDGSKKPIGTKVPSKMSLLDLASKTKSSNEDGDSSSKARGKADDVDEDSLDEYLDDEESSSSGFLSGKMPLVIGVGISLVVVVALAAITLGGSSNTDRQPNLDHLQSGVSDNVIENEGVTNSPNIPNDNTSLPQIGIQDFTGNTNMSNSDVLTDPSKFVEDISGLTVRVDYRVKSLSSVADFVSYTKHRGTWGGGLELYWLDVTYHDSHYVMQIPFKYYKELSETGIVPVKMEVATVEGTSADEEFTIITYMELDEKTLKAVQKAQG